MRIVDWLSGLGYRFRPGDGPRPHRRPRRGRRSWQDASGAWLLEERRLLSRLHAAAPIPMPGNTVAGAGDVLWMGDPNLPTKLITFTNNTDRIVYPFLEDANSDEDGTTGIGLYDPYDPLNQEYRGYIGYTAADGQDYLGLRPGQKVTVAVPLVFWDAGRMEIATVGQDLTPDLTQGSGSPNPFQYYAFDSAGVPTARYTVPAVDAAQSHGVVMWYHATIPSGPANDAPAQLGEMTFRDPYLDKLPTRADIPASEKTTLINYDVSYVDSIAMPVAMEAADVALFPNDPASPHRAYGWVGSVQTYDDMESRLQAFTSDDPSMNGLGSYFVSDGVPRGYDRFYNPDPADAGVKLPAGQNIIGESPLNNVRSSYDNNRYALLSGGSGPIEVVNGAFPDGTTTLKLVPPPPSDPDRLDALKPGMTVTSGTPGIVPAGTTIVAVNRTAGKVTSVTLSAAATDENGASFVFTFARPVMDYVASKITDLWYGWAQYYVGQNQVPGVADVTGATTKGSNVLTFDAPVAGLVPGMQVTSGGGNLAPGITTTILAVAPGGTSVDLSTAATGSGSASYTFNAPQPIPGTNEVHPLALSFRPDARAKADRFAQVVYSLMSAMSTAPASDGVGVTSSRLMYNVLGGNIGFIQGTNAALALEYTNEVKSLLRGVYDDTRVPESSGQWYPDPAKAADGSLVDGATPGFNVYNLNPFVWFVHQRLGLSGYGFSLDDDVSDVGAPGANHLLVSIGGTGGLDNTNEWKPAASFGPVASATGQIQKGSTSLTGLDRDVVAELNAANPNTGALGAKVTGPGIAPGTTVESPVIGGTTVILSTPATADGVADASNPYHFSV